MKTSIIAIAIATISTSIAACDQGTAPASLVTNEGSVVDSLVNNMSLDDLARLLNAPVGDDFTEAELANARDDEELLQMIQANEFRAGERAAKARYTARRKEYTRRQLEARGIHRLERMEEEARREKARRNPEIWLLQ